MNTESNTTTATDENNDPNVIVLETPIQRGEQVIRSVRLRKPNAGELRGLKLHELAQMDVTALVTLLPRISQPLLTQHDASQLEPADLVEIARVIGGFFEPRASKQSPSA
ncbi:TPA: phage tail assembly protein [Stenotrophomonas maltophilia]|uniref:Phage tail assembly protein n=1 Tax=Stenotrophomonas maltophilia TaxID=40324 RepID=A0AAI9CIC8_STEMA|nr:phage tail assembly protein [Stenotrophomonas maltophilia]EKZ1926026.1 phage tail assembly protein [Stenotrophomonas maltophilia]EMB2745107.1 phage tail assembly protein [Stenotrophomonas maltophilia]MBH1418512.1 phage tail assembly protein [Stenotrophomonas maltophilia]MBH1464109.1 phage tail assembly protein [Stenotrophomonas maltophilia]MBH1614684.1 phage tail assembly protein [Stenotrophomonas maltophilia]